MSVEKVKVDDLLSFSIRKKKKIKNETREMGFYLIEPVLNCKIPKRSRNTRLRDLFPVGKHKLYFNHVCT